MADVEKVEKKHGGKRSGSGRKAAIGKDKLDTVKKKITSHALEQVEKKSRLLHLLDTLYDEGIAGNVVAIKEYFDRVLGKVPQSIAVPPGSGSGRFTLEWEESPKK